MRVHHSFSAEPFSKDKFEYVLVAVLRLAGVDASLAPKGNPGHDVTLNGVKVSLRTQADKGIKESRLWISKFMELGKGNWGADPRGLVGLRDQFFHHMRGYERILSLRASVIVKKDVRSFTLPISRIRCRLAGHGPG